MPALRKLFLSLVIAGVFFTLTSGSSYAKIGSRIWGVNGQLVSTLTGGGYSEFIADGAGGAFVVWEKDGAEIYAQKISASGALGWGATGVKISGDSVATQPKVVLDGSGGIVVAWYDYYDSGGGVFAYRINAQRVNASGAIVWAGSPDGLPLGTMAFEETRDQVYRNSTDTLRLIRTADGYYTVAYKATDPGVVDSLYVKMQRVDADGALQWGVDSVTIFTGDLTTYDISNIEMTIDEWGGTFVLWYNYGGTDADIYLMRINAGGTDDWAFTIDVSNNAIASPQQVTGMRITRDGAGGLYVFWHVYEETVAATLYGQRIASEGTLYWAAGGIALNTAAGGAYQQLIGVAETNTTYAVVTYMVALANDVRTMKVDSDGTILWTATSFLDGWLGYGTTTNTAVLSNGDVMVGTQTNLTVNSVNMQNIALQKLDGTTGAAQWTAENFAISYPGMALNTTMNYAILPDPVTETTLLLWSEGAYENQQFYAQRTGDAYQVANLDASLDTVSTLDTNIEVGSHYGIGEEFTDYTDTVRLNNGGGLRVSDVETVFTEDRDWTGVSGEANGTTGVSVVSGLATAPGAAATHALYIPKIGAEITLHICPAATVLADVTAACASGYDLATSDASISEVTVSGTDYWRVGGLTGTGGMVVTPVSASDTTPPSVPGDPETEDPTSDNTPKWKWTASTDDTGLGDYKVAWCNNDDWDGCSNYYADTSTNDYTHTDPLADGTWYFRVRATDTSGNRSDWSDLGEVLIDTEGPQITDIQYTVYEDYIDLTWSTDEEGTTELEWHIQIDRPYLYTYANDTLVETHAYRLSPTIRNAKYNAYLHAEDALGNDSEITTVVIDTSILGEGRPLVLSGVSAKPSYDSAVISWSTNLPADSVGYYGTQSALGSSVQASELVLAHVLTITGLSEDTTYYYRVSSATATETKQSEILTFKTLKRGEVTPTPTPTPSEEDDEDDETKEGGIVSAISNVREFVKSNDALVKTTSAVAWVLPLIAASLPWLVQVLPYVNPASFIALLFGLLRKKKYPWGVVFDSKTKQPVDPVILTLVDTDGKKTQAVCDLFGRYEFLVEPGKYTLSAVKTNYAFPSKALAGRESDEVYDDLYFGQEIEIKPNQKIAFNIPMDAVAEDWNQQEKKRMGIENRFNKLYAISKVIFGIGFAWTIIATILSPTVGNLIVSGLYVVVFGHRLYSKNHKPWGIVYTNGSPLEGAVVKLVNVKFPILHIAPVVTKSSGRYNYLVGKGNYQVNVSLKQADGQYKEVYKSRTLPIEKEFGSIGEDIKL